MSTRIPDLIAYLKGSIPHPDALCEVRQPQFVDGVTFVWFATRFFANSSFEVFELRGQKLYITPASLLLQALLATVKHQRETLNSALLHLRNAEQALANRHVHAAAKGIQITREDVEREMGLAAAGEAAAKHQHEPHVAGAK